MAWMGLDVGNNIRPVLELGKTRADNDIKGALFYELFNIAGAGPEAGRIITAVAEQAGVKGG